MTGREIFAALNTLAPVETALDFDNPGFLVGRKDAEVTRVLVALDITHAVVEEAAACGANLIVSHHPVIFAPLSSVTDESVVYSLISKNISAICMHTNLDAAKGGVNDTLAALLGLSDVEIPEADPLMRIGTVPECGMDAFLARFCNALGLSVVKYRGESPVQKIGLCGGAAGEGAALAFSLGCDTYITGEVKHHQWLEDGKNLIEGGHFATENPICETLVRYLKEAFPSLTVTVAKANRDPASIFISKE